MLLNKKISVPYFLKLIKYDVIAIAIYAFLAGTFDHSAFLKNVTVPLPVSAFVGTLLSLLLAFRTSQSYERWWEARMVWGAIVNDSRTLISQIQQFIPDQDKILQFTNQQIVWCYALSQSLRKLPWSGIVERYVNEQAVSTNNLPNYLLSAHTTLLSKAALEIKLDPNKHVQIDSTISRLCDAMGKCERIKNTVFPRSYSVLLHFMIYVLMTILPFGLEDNSKYVEIGLTFLIPVLFISLERTAILMQDPFENKPTDTPTTTISRTIESNLKEMTGQGAEAPLAEQPESYYMM